MSDTAATSLRETLLRQCLAADPVPWYPKDYAQAAGIDREGLYGPLNDLRVANLVQLTDWVAGKGQGYVLTMLGREVLSDPAALAQLRDGAPRPRRRRPARPRKPRSRRRSTSARRPGGCSTCPASSASCRCSYS